MNLLSFLDSFHIDGISDLHLDGLDMNHLEGVDLSHVHGIDSSHLGEHEHMGEGIGHDSALRFGCHFEGNKLVYNDHDANGNLLSDSHIGNSHTGNAHGNENHLRFGGYYNADGTYHYTSDNTDRDPQTGAIVRRW